MMAFTAHPPGSYASRARRVGERHRHRPTAGRPAGSGHARMLRPPSTRGPAVIVEQTAPRRRVEVGLVADGYAGERSDEEDPGPHHSGGGSLSPSRRGGPSAVGVAHCERVRLQAVAA